MKQIQATFIGYGGDPCTVYSAYDDETRVLVVAVSSRYVTERRGKSLVITNNRDIARDELFTEDKLKQAIDAFFILSKGVASDGASSRLTFSERAVNANPENSLEKDGITESGSKYRIAEGVTCAQMAVLATCLHAVKSETIARTVTFAEQLARLSRGGIMTI